MSAKKVNRKTKPSSSQNAEKHSVVYFGSQSANPFHLLSNFAIIKPEEGTIFFRGFHFNSAEHAYQSLKFPQDKIYLLSVDGPYSKFTCFVDEGPHGDVLFANLSPEKKVLKMKYWEKKGNIGIIAKMISAPDVMEKLGIVPVPIQYSDDIWLDILRQKFQIPRFRQILKPSEPLKNKQANVFINNLYRGTETLIEFSKSAKSSDSFFGACVDSEDGKIYGNNYMGKMLMKIRDEIF